MKNNNHIQILKPFLMVFALMALFSSCKEDEPELADPPVAADANFTYTPSAQTDNILEFRASNQNIQAFWDLGNGSFVEGVTAVGVYPAAGIYTVTLTIFNQGGSTSSVQDVVIENDDPGLLDNPIFDLLTGGTSGPGSKSWVIDSLTPGHFGVGPNPSPNGDFPAYYAAAALEKSGSGMYNDVYTFTLQGFQFDMVTNGDIYLNTAQLSDWPDAFKSDVGDYTSPFPDQIGKAWTYSEGEDTLISISADAFIGYFTGVRTYKIVTIEENLLFLRMEDSQDAALAWYLRLIPEGYIPDPNETPLYNLPLDFETVEPEVNAFGGSTVAYINNPDPSGINTSSRVMETVHGFETFAGFSVNMENPLDFSTDNTISIKVWAPSTGVFRLKLEEQSNPGSFAELDVDVTAANSWQQLTFDFTGAANTFDRITMFPGWNVANAGTFYLDDISQP
jgi:PKD repeat protein